MPLVSVIIPAYNAEPFIAETVESALAQTLQDIEVIVVDDGSKDGTGRVVQAIAGARYVHKPNGGVSAARNLGAQLAQGEFLAFLDSDDIWHPDKLRQQVQAMRQHPDCMMSKTALTGDADQQAAIRNGATRDDAPHRVMPDLRDSFLRPYFATSTVVVRKAAFDEAGGFDSGLRIAEDVDFYLRVLARHPKLIQMTETLLYKRTVEGSLGEDSVAGYHQLIKVYDRFLAQHPQARQVLGDETISLGYHQLYIALARSHLWVGESADARKAARQAMDHGPAQASWPLILKSFVPTGVRRILRRQAEAASPGTS